MSQCIGFCTPVWYIIPTGTHTPIHMPHRTIQMAFQMYKTYRNRRQMIRRDHFETLPQLYGKSKQNLADTEPKRFLLKNEQPKNKENEHKKIWNQMDKVEIDTDPDTEPGLPETEEKEDLSTLNIKEWLDKIVQDPVAPELEKPDPELPPVSSHLYLPKPKKDSFSAQLIRRKEQKHARGRVVPEETPVAYKLIRLSGAITAGGGQTTMVQPSNRCPPGILGAISERVITTGPLPRPVFTIYPVPNSMALYRRHKQLDCERAIMNCWLKRGHQFSRKISMADKGSHLNKKRAGSHLKSLGVNTLNG